MRSRWLPLAAGWLLTLVVPAQDGSGSRDAASQPESRRVPGTPAERVAAIDQEYEATIDAFSKAYEAAATDDDRAKLYREKYPKPTILFPRLLEIANTDPKDPGATSALIWIV